MNPPPFGCISEHHHVSLGAALAGLGCRRGWLGLREESTLLFVEGTEMFLAVKATARSPLA